jgi:Icc-related predicted phosphoesterase
MKILAFSDWRSQNIDDIFRFIETISEPIDVILYAGDDVRRFHSDKINYFTKLAKYTRQKKVLAVIGNDDGQIGKSILQGKNVYDIHEEPMIIGDFGFMGLEGATSGPGFCYSEKYVEKHLKKQYKKMKSKQLIIVSHPPPHGILDYGIRFATEDEETHNIGSKSLKNFISKKDTQLVVCGHCHSQGGISQKDHNTTIANVSSHDDTNAKGNFALIELNGNTEPQIQWCDTTQLIDPNSIMNIHGIGPKIASKFKKIKIETIKDLAKIQNLKKISQKTSFSEEQIQKIKLKARSVVENKTFQISELILPSNNLIFFDIETDLKREKVWLVGILDNGNFTQYFAKNWKQEKLMLEKLLSFLQTVPDSTLVSFSGTGFDRNVINRALERLNLDSEFFMAIPHIDLCQLIRQSIIFPNQSYALKNLGTYLRYPFKHADMNGLEVALEYLNHLKRKRKLDERVFDYNADDVNALPYIIKKIESDGYIIKRR